jgi:hypothetical protein
MSNAEKSKCLAVNRRVVAWIRSILESLTANGVRAAGVAQSELRLNSIRSSATRTSEIPAISIVRMKYQNSLCSLFAIQFQLPKLNVAGLMSCSSRSSQRKRRVRGRNRRPLQSFATSYRGIEYPPRRLASGESSNDSIPIVEKMMPFRDNQRSLFMIATPNWHAGSGPAVC